MSTWMEAVRGEIPSAEWEDLKPAFMDMFIEKKRTFWSRFSLWLDTAVRTEAEEKWARLMVLLRNDDGRAGGLSAGEEILWQALQLHG